MGLLRIVMWPFSFKGTLSRIVYAPLALLLLLAPQLAALAFDAGAAARFGLTAPDNSLETLAFWLTPEIPFRELSGQGHAFMGFALAPVAALYLLVVAWLIVVWMSVSLAFRRAAAAGIGGEAWAAAAAAAPIVQIPVILWLCVAPPRTVDLPPVADLSAPGEFPPPKRLRSRAAIEGVMIGAAISVVAMGVATLVFGVYGFGLFAATPLVAGYVSGFIANRDGDIGGAQTFKTVVGVGAALGRQSVLARRAASPMATWRAMLAMRTIKDQPALPFRLGLAYPVRGEVIGEGVGAIRHGYFSTGMAVERITAWAPGRRLAFVILNDAPSLHELSPYAHVHAPHVDGYFLTSDAAFSLTPLADGRTRMTLTTRHSLDLQPAPYWTPLARWAIHANKVRVLTQIARQAETEPSVKR